MKRIVLDQKIEIRDPEPGTRDQGPGTRDPGPRTRDPGPKGVILILVLWIFAALTLFMYSFLYSARVEYQASTGSADRLRAQALASSAVEYSIATLFENNSPIGGPWSIWYDNAGRFKDVEVPDPGGGKDPYGYFTVFFSDYLEDNTPLKYGVQDEAGKLNLNTATREMLLQLTPRMTEEIVDAIIDWRDSDEIPGSAGAESNYYQSLQKPYRCKNAPFETVEELLYVRGVDAMVLYGEDWNRNGVLDANENDGEKNDPPDNEDGRLELGLWHLCTVYSYDTNLTNDGQMRANINTASLPELQSVLANKASPDQIRAIVVGRINGPYPSIGAMLFLPGWDSATFQACADLVTVADPTASKLPGLVNVNTAPRQVLRVLPGMTDDLADAVASYRRQATEPLDNIGWLLNVMDRNVFTQLANFVTVRSRQFSIQAVGWVPNQRGLPPVYARTWAAVDMMVSPPKVLALKDLTPFGFPYPLAESGE